MLYWKSSKIKHGGLILPITPHTNTQCNQFNECYHYERPTSEGKLVTGIEYNNIGGNVCERAAKDKMLMKYHDGDADKWVNCF